MPNVKKHSRYFKEMGGAMLLYTIMLFVSLRVGAGMEPGLAQTAVYVSPMLAFFLAIWAVVRQIRRSDEFLRKVSVEHLAITAAVTAGWTFTYGFLENAGFPKLSMFAVWPVMGATWAILSIVEALRHR